MMQPTSNDMENTARLRYDSPASSYKKGISPGNSLASPSYLSPKSKAFLNPPEEENVGEITPPTSKASSSPGDEYSPMTSCSRESSGSGIIDHTALLLGLHDELEEESDDEARQCCFSTKASKNALDGVIDSDSDDSESTSSDQPPLQLAIDTMNRGIMTVAHNNSGASLSLVAMQLENEERIAAPANKSEHIALKSATMKAKASNVFNAKAQKAKQRTLDVITPKMSFSNAISTRKSEQRINDELSAASSKGKLAAKQAGEMMSSMKDKAAQKANEVKDKATQRAHKVKDKTLEVVGRKTYHKSDEHSQNDSEVISLLSDDIGSDGSGATSPKAAAKRIQKKLPNLPRPPKTLSLKKGTINKKLMSSMVPKRTQSKATIDQPVEVIDQSAACSQTVSSLISPTSSYDLSSCIDSDGFLLSPQSSLGFISPTGSIDEYSSGVDSNVTFDAFSDTDKFGEFETSSSSRVKSNLDDDGEILSKELKAAIQNKAWKPPLPPSGRSRQI